MRNPRNSIGNCLGPYSMSRERKALVLATRDIEQDEEAMWLLSWVFSLRILVMIGSRKLRLLF